MPEDGPTDQRLAHAAGFHTQSGPSKKTRRYSMLDDALGRAWMRRKISDGEYYALRRYGLHWLAGGLQGALGTLDLDRVFAHDPGTMSGLAKTERQQDHRDAFHAAHDAIGQRPALVADAVVCAGFRLVEAGLLLGYRSAAHARAEAGVILSDAGYRLSQFWKERDR